MNSDTAKAKSKVALCLINDIKYCESDYAERILRLTQIYQEAKDAVKSIEEHQRKMAELKDDRL